MSVRRKARMLLLACLLIAGCAALGACAKSASSPVAEDDGVLKRPVGGVTLDANDPAFVMIEDIRYYYDDVLYENREPSGSSSVYSIAEYTLDEFGNCTLFEKTMEYNATTYAFSEEYSDPGLGLDCISAPAIGFPKDSLNSDSSVKKYFEAFDNDRVFSLDDGYATQCVCGDTLAQFEYYPSGRIKSVHHRKANGERLYNTRNGEVAYAYFNEAGYVTSTDLRGSLLSGYSNPREYKWEFDDNGFPVAYTMTTENPYRMKNEAREQRYTLDTDEYGNITAIYRDMGNGRGLLLRRMAYQRVDKPSYWVRLYSAGVLQW